LGNPAGRGYNPRTEVRRMGRPGPTNYNPFSRFTAPRTPGPLGRNDAADPGILTSRGETPGSLGLNDDAAYDVARMVDPMDFDYLVNHYESKSHLVESVRLADLHLKEKHGLWSKQSIWGVGGAIVFRVSNLSEDLDGSARAYHPPTDASWSGYGHGLGKDSLANAVGNPGVTKYAHSKKEEDWALTAGCQLFRDLHKAKGLEPKATAASQPAAGKSPAPNQASADKAANDAKDALDAIFKKYGVTKLSDLEAKSKSAVCVLYVDGRAKKDSQDDWSHVVHWAGIKTDRSGKPIVRSSGPDSGFYIPAITPGWADAEKHPWVVLNPPEDQFGVKLTNSAVVIKNSETPSIAYGMVADVGPKGHLGEVSRKMMDDLGFAGATPSGDYIVVLFPQNVSDADIGKEKEVSVIQSDAKAAFEAWTWKGRSGIELIKELFPTPEQYHRAQKDFANAKKYLTGYIDQLMLKLQ
jgi:hypothetical protein